jgi:ribosome-binding protein aMBF1 (putative translation factor)
MSADAAKKRYHLFSLWGASTKTALCGRKLVDPWTVDHKGMHDNVCASCTKFALKDGRDPKKYSPIEDRGGSR